MLKTILFGLAVTSAACGGTPSEPNTPAAQGSTSPALAAPTSVVQAPPVDTSQRLEAARAQQREALDVGVAQNDAASIGDRCVDIEALRAKATAASSPKVADVYTHAADQRIERERERAKKMLLDRAQEVNAKVRPEDLATMTTSDGKCDANDTSYPLADGCSMGVVPRERVATLRDETERLKCFFSEEKYTQVKQLVDSIAAAVEDRINTEEKCRSTPGCMAPRIQSLICGYDARVKEIKQGIARERANPGGVVNMKSLHDWGEEVQMTDDKIKELRGYYSRVVKKPAPACSK